MNDALASDLQLANELTGPEDLRFDLAPARPGDIADLRLKVVSHKPVSLTTIMPHLAALGIEVTDERPSMVETAQGPVRLYDLGFRHAAGIAFDDRAATQRFADALRASYGGVAEADGLTRLVLGADLTWQQVVYLRALSRYLKQAGVNYSQTYIANALTANPEITRALVEVFEVKFDPKRPFADLAARAAAVEVAVGVVEAALENVASLDQDRILRMLLAVIKAIVRTNAFAEDQPGFAFKLLPSNLPLLPEPRPMFEIFVYSTEVQGVHLRFGKVARGGLRWSDRSEDFRTEVLGLVKAQLVKNTVIVPVGAKGGFVPANLPNPAVDRQAWYDAGVSAYKRFVSSLLSLTDNIVDGAIVPPADVLRYDSDDPYLVVAADKGTATFSDFANGISLDRGFWLGDAFASGGSVGYDHKAMGITARGAWESVKRHFFEMGKDCQTEDFTCVGIGDMAGDVFGNGMMLSEHIKLVAAFNHLHVFLDPNPEPATSFAERVRLFNTPRSTWADYNPALISAGGGVFPRTAKSIPVGPEVRAALGLADDVTKMTPNELINAILKAPVDLLWNGGIGTYVKASSETHEDAGDKANDAVRVNGAEVRAKIAGEGGNLGWTQKGRIEYAQNGGRINTDFIDNSAGVDTSDHEVNIKILLAAEVAAGRLTTQERNELLASMTDDVATLVLAHNIDQNIALSCATYRAPAMAPSHEAWMRVMEEHGKLDRGLESLPTTAQMAQRIAAGRGLTRPELCSVLSWTKIWLYEMILDSDLPDDPYLADRLITYFPKALRDRYADRMPEHRLHREIVATVTVNRFVNSQGLTSYFRLSEETSSNIAQIIRAQLAARNIMQIARLEQAMTTKGVDPTADVIVRIQLRRMVERATRWLLGNRRGTLDIKAESAFFQAGVAEVLAHLLELMTARHLAGYEELKAQLLAGGAAPELAHMAAQARYGHMALPIVQTAHRLGRPVMDIARVMFAVAEGLGLDIMFDQVVELPVAGRWDLMAQAALRDDLARLETDITAAVATAAPNEPDADKAVAIWLEQIDGAEGELRTLREITQGPGELARLSVALRTLRAMLA
nr:NAD-glutamate dehydrogenase [Propionibacterium sp.]